MVNGPYGRYAPVRGSQALVLRQLRCADWTAGVDALAVRIGRPARTTWLSVALLAERGLVKYRKRDDGTLRIWTTRIGREILL